MNEPPGPLTIRDVRPWGCARSDVVVEEGRISAVRPHDQHAVPGPGAVIEGRGRLALPSFTDAHVHLDSTRIGLPFQSHRGGPGIWGMVLNDRHHWREDPWPVARRAEHTLGQMIAHGTTRVRSYAQIDADCALERFEAVLQARQAHADRCTVEIIAFPQAGLFREPGVSPLIEEALRNGAGVVGGIDPCQLERDPVRHLDRVFKLAQRYQAGVDVHLHEPGHLAVFSAELIMERTRALGMQGKVSISHGYELGRVEEPVISRVVEGLAELDIALVGVAPPRAGIPVDRLAEAGIRVGLGEDGQRDHWSPYGNGDMLDRTWQLAFTHGYRHDHLIELCLAVATVGGASVLDPSQFGVPARGAGFGVGDVADLVLVGQESVAAAVMDRPADRTVLHRGHVVADGLVLT